MEKEYASTTSSVPEEYWDNAKEGYGAGFNWAVKHINDRFFYWFVAGLFIGTIGGFFLRQGIWVFLSVAGLIYLVGKVHEIEIKR